MWHALIRGSVFSSIRSSSPLPSDNPSANSHPSSQNRLTDPSSINNCNKAEPADDSTGHSPPSKNYDQDKNLDAAYDDYNLNSWMNKGISSSLAHTMDESLPSTEHNKKVTTNGLDTSPSTSSLRSLRASRPLLAIAASRPSYNSDRSSALIGSGEQIKPDHHDRTYLKFTDDDDDDDDDDDNDDGDDDDVDANDDADMNGTNDEYDDNGMIGTIGNNNDSNQWNDKKYQRQATIINIPSRTPKRPTNATTTKKKLKQTTTDPNASDKPKKKRRWENVSPPSSPTKLNYEVSMATIASPPNKRKPTGQDVPRPHACPLCDRRFNRRYNLTAHIRVHDPDRKKLFDCPSCNQSFDRKHDRDRHADALHFEHKHRCYCHLCDASFTRRDALTRHVHKLHTQGETPTSSSPSSADS